MTDHDPTICRCGCHFPRDGFAMMHFAPCCDPCPECDELIVCGMRDEHKPYCAGGRAR